MWRKRIKTSILLLIFFSLVFIFTAVGKSEVKLGQADVSSGGNEEIIIPTVNDVRLNGYPLNESGMTYGPDVRDNTGEPDLILVCNELGQKGYVKKSDFDDGVTTLEEAANSKQQRRTVNMYSHDGITIVGIFTIG